MTETIADRFVTARSVTDRSVKHLVDGPTFETWLIFAGSRVHRLIALCGREVEAEDPDEPSRTCSRCLGKATGRQKRAITRTVTRIK